MKLNKESKVLFVCCENMGRSQIGKALYNHLTDSTSADSAGTGYGKEFRKGDTIAELERFMSEDLGRPIILTTRSAIFDRIGIDISDSPRMQLTPEMLQKYDLVINIAEKWQTPEWLRGDNVVWWDVHDPGMIEDYDERAIAVHRVLEDIEKRVKEIINGNIIDDDIDNHETGKESESFLKRQSVRAVVLDENDRIALLHSKKYDWYDLPGGGVENSETAEEAIVREVKEECGLEVKVVDRFGQMSIYVERDNTINTAIGFTCKFIKEIEYKPTGDELETKAELVWAEGVDDAIYLLTQRGGTDSHPVKRNKELLEQYKERAKER